MNATAVFIAAVLLAVAGTAGTTFPDYRTLASGPQQVHPGQPREPGSRGPLAGPTERPLRRIVDGLLDVVRGLVSRDGLHPVRPPIRLACLVELQPGAAELALLLRMGRVVQRLFFDLAASANWGASAEAAASVATQSAFCQAVNSQAFRAYARRSPL
jgi:hypothetical protein